MEVRVVLKRNSPLCYGLRSGFSDTLWQQIQVDPNIPRLIEDAAVGEISHCPPRRLNLLRNECGFGIEPWFAESSAALKLGFLAS